MKQVSRYFPDEEYARGREAVRERLDERALDAVLITSPENIYYLTGLDHMGSAFRRAGPAAACPWACAPVRSFGCGRAWCST